MYNKIIPIFFLFITINLSGQNIRINGTLINNRDSIIRFKFFADPLTSEKDEYCTMIYSTDHFSFTYHLNAPRQTSFQIGNKPELGAILYLFPGSNIYITADCNSLKKTLNIRGDHQKLTQIQDQLFDDHFLPDSSYINKSYKDWEKFEEQLRSYIRKKLKVLDSLRFRDTLSKIEYDYAWAEIYYSFFRTYMWTTWKWRIPEDDEVYSFYDLLDLNNDTISLMNNNYNTYVEYALMHEFRKQNNKLTTKIIPDSSFYFSQYNFGKVHLSDTVRDVFLSRLLYRVLNRGIPGADRLFNNYQIDCNNTQLKNIIKNEYYVYRLAKINSSENNYIIETDPDKDFKSFILKHKGKILLLEYWGSWCSPCIKTIPKIKKLKEHFPQNDFEVIHIAVNDNYEMLKFAIEKYKIEGLNILLPPETASKWRKEIDFYTVPYYTLINRSGEIVEDGPLDLISIEHLSAIIKELMD